MHRLWLAFWMMNLLTAILANHAWMLGFYEWMLAALGLATVILAGALIRASLARPVTFGFIATGLVIGQWRLLESLLMQLMWRVGGFAP